MFILLIVVLLGTGFSSIGMENLIRNPDFKQVSGVGLPIHWELRPFNKKLVSFSDNSVRLGVKGKKSKMTLIQFGIPFIPNKCYEVSFKVRSPQETKFRSYIEWTSRDKTGKLSYRTVNAKYQKTSKDWKLKSFLVTVPPKTNSPYIVFAINNATMVEISQIQIKAFSMNTRLRNGDFSLREGKTELRYWQLKATNPNCLEMMTNAIKLAPKTNEQALLIQRNINLIPGKSYEVSYEVKSQKENKYRVYCEWLQGAKLSSINVHFQKASKKWSKEAFVFTYPSKGKNIYIVLQVAAGPSEIEFRNIKIKSKVIKKISTLNGQWHTSNRARVFLSKKNKAVLELPNGKITKSKGLLKGISLIAGQRYCLTFKTWGIGKAGTSTGYFPFRVSMLFNDSIDNSGTWDDTWEKPQIKSFIFTAPNISKKVNGTIIFESTSNGSVLFNSFELKKIKAAPRKKAVLVINSPFFCDSLFANSSEKNISGYVKTTNSITEANISLFDAKEDELMTKKIDISERKGNFSFPAANLSYGVYKLIVKLKDKDNKSFTITRIINKLAPTKTTITCRPDRVICINNKAFFPIFFWSIFKGANPTSLYHAARNGVNSFLLKTQTMTAAKKTLDLANTFNMKVILFMGYPTITKSGGLTEWEHRVSGIITPEIKNHPALLGFLLVDEPAWSGKKISTLKKGYETLKKLAPNHPIWINAAPRGALETHQKFSEVSDIYGVDIYPVPYPSGHSGLADKGLTSVGKYTKMMNRACAYRKPIWIVLQSFAWGAWTNMPRNKLVYPNYIESRFVAYDAILSGATGISYWGARTVERKDFAAIIYRVTKELRMLSGLFVRENCKVNINSSNKKIKLKAWTYEGNLFIIAINQSKQKQNVSFRKLSVNNKFKVLNENRSINVNNGTFKDEFKPYEVHIYCGGKLPEPTTALPEYNESLENKGFFAEEAVTKYNGNAMWIWEESSKQKIWSKVGLSRKFYISTKIKDAIITITADDYYKLYINGNKVGFDDNGWSIAEKYNCTKLLKKGENIIHIIASDAGRMPCGVLVDFKITSNDGTVQNIISDTNWRAVKNPPENWFENNKNANAAKVAVITPYGGGAWGCKLKVARLKH